MKTTREERIIQRNIEYNSERVDTQFWIDTFGKVHKYTGDMTVEIASMHGEIARRLYPDSIRPTDILKTLGWIIIGSTAYGGAVIEKRPTTKQIRTLHRLNLYDILTFPHNGYYVNYDENQHLLDTL